MNQLAKEAQEKFQVVNECSLPLSTAIENQFALYRVDGTKSSHNITQQYDSATYNTGTVKYVCFQLNIYHTVKRNI